MTQNPADVKTRPPSALDPGDIAMAAEDEMSGEWDSATDLEDPNHEEIAIPGDQSLARRTERGIRWAKYLLISLTGLVGLFAGLWIEATMTSLLARNDFIGWTALALIALGLLSLFMLMMKEAFGLLRLRRLHRLRQSAEHCLLENDEKQVSQVLRQLMQVMDRQELRRGKQNLQLHLRDIHAPREQLVLAERELLLSLDKQARQIIAHSARRISVVTAVSPAAVFDVLFVAFENLRMLRRIAANYGGRPGTVGLFRLARMVLAHLAFTGGLAFTSDIVQQFISTKLTAKLSARLGEGLFNAAMTTRIGIAALDICRPLPFIEAEKPKLREFIGAVTRSSP
ncbi:MAG: YcjF family protein [Methyloligellaceae bacterium]